MSEIRLTEEQNKAILEKVQEKIKDYSCPLCKSKDATIQAYIINMQTSNNFSVRIGGDIMPVVPIICSNCGNTSFVSILTLGLGYLFDKK